MNLKVFCDPSRIQTYNRLIRSQVLYSVELWDRFFLFEVAKIRLFYFLTINFIIFFCKIYFFSFAYQYNRRLANICTFLALNSDIFLPYLISLLPYRRIILKKEFFCFKKTVFLKLFLDKAAIKSQKATLFLLLQ